MKSSNIVVCAAALAMGASLAPAAIVRVTVTGTVENNAFPNNGTNTFGGIAPGAPVLLVMDLDSNVYLDSPNLPGKTRGYNILPGQMHLTIGSVTVARRETTAAYFVLRNNDPRADGFFISQGTDIDTEIPLQMVPANYGIQFQRTFSIDTVPPLPDDSLTSLDLLQAQGTWAYNDLSVFNFAIGLGEFSLPMILDYQTITVERVCPADMDNGSGTGTPDGGVDINDLLFFLTAFEAGNVSADLDNDGNPAFGIPDAGVDINDLLFFLARFEAGC